jgi:hypothetical protein
VTSPPAPGPLETVALLEEEVVLAGGAGVVNWLVRYNDGWVRAGRHPTASSEKLDRGSGVVWRTRITLTLVRGTPLQRLEVRPDTRPKTALEHLERGSRGALRAKKVRHFLVGERGELVLATDAPK